MSFHANACPCLLNNDSDRQLYHLKKVYETRDIERQPKSAVTFLHDIFNHLINWNSSSVCKARPKNSVSLSPKWQQTLSRTSCPLALTSTQMEMSSFVNKITRRYFLCEKRQGTRGHDQASSLFFIADKQKISPERCRLNLKVGVSDC